MGSTLKKVDKLNALRTKHGLFIMKKYALLFKSNIIADSDAWSDAYLVYRYFECPFLIYLGEMRADTVTSYHLSLQLFSNEVL